MLRAITCLRGATSEDVGPTSILSCRTPLEAALGPPRAAWAAVHCTIVGQVAPSPQPCAHLWEAEVHAEAVPTELMWAAGPPWLENLPVIKTNG